MSTTDRIARIERGDALDAPRGSRTPASRAAAALAVGAIGVVLLTLLVSSRIGGLGLVGLLVPAVLAAAAITATAPVDRAFGLVCFFVAALPIGAFEVGPLQVVQLFAVLAAGGVFAIETARGDYAPVPWPIGLPLTAMVVSAALSTYVSPAPDVTFRLDIALVVSLLLIAASHSVISSPARLRTVARILVAAAAFIGATSIGGAGQAEVSNAGAVVTGRAIGIFAQPNELGIFCALLLPIAAALALSEPSRRGRLLATAGAAAIFAGLAVSLSRGAWTGAVVGMLAFWMFLPDRRRFLVPVASATAGALALLVILSRVPIIGIINQRLLSLVDGTSNPYDERPAIYAEARRQISVSPWIGNGPGAYPTVATQLSQDGYYLQAEHAHNLFLNTWAEYGLIGLACLIALMVGLASRLLPASRAVRDRIGDDVDALMVSRMIAGTTAGLVAVLAHGVVDYPLRNPITSTTLWFVVGLAAASARVAGGFARRRATAGARVAATEPRASEASETPEAYARSREATR